MKSVQFGPFQQDFPETQNLRAVRIIGRFAPGMVLAMDRDPGFGEHGGAHPQPKTENMSQRRMQIQAAMSGIAMQVECDAHERELDGQERVQHVTPEIKIHESVQKIQIQCSSPEVGQAT